jgi:hypothetical protein
LTFTQCAEKPLDECGGGYPRYARTGGIDFDVFTPVSEALKPNSLGSNTPVCSRTHIQALEQKQESRFDDCNYIARYAFCDEQKLTDGFGEHTEPMLGTRCSRLQLQRQKSAVRHLA